MHKNKVIGLLLIILGIGSVWWGYDISESLEGEVTQLVQGQDAGVMVRYAVGAILIVVGVFFAIRRG